MRKDGCCGAVSGVGDEVNRRPLRCDIVAEDGAVSICLECSESLLVELENARVRDGSDRSIVSCEDWLERCFHCGCAVIAPTDSDEGSSSAVDETEDSDARDVVLDEESLASLAEVHERFLDVCEREPGLMELVLSFLSPKSIARLSMVCRPLCVLLWGRPVDLLDLEERRWFRKSDLVRLFVSRHVRRRWLLEGAALDCRDASVSEFTVVALQPLALRSLALRNAGNTGLHGLERCKWLMKLDLSYDGELENLEALSSLEDLRVLSLLECDNIASVKALSSCEQLRELKLCGCRNLYSLEGLDECKRLEKLDLNSCFSLFSDDSSQILRKLSGLKWLSLQNCSQLQRCPKLPETLQHLDLAMCDQLMFLNALDCVSESLETLLLASCDSLADISVLGTLKKLTLLDLSNCYMLQDVSPLSRCTSMRRLSLSGCVELEEVRIESCCGLETINLTGCEKLRNLDQIGSCKRLKRLDVPFCTALTCIKGLEKCDSLEYVNITRCDALMDVAPLSKLSNLQELSIRWCPQISMKHLELFRTTKLQLNF